MKKYTFTHRLMARFVIEATTPLAVGSGEKSIVTDSLVVTDVNGLPYIPGTSLAGVLRHSLKEVSKKNRVIDSIFGYQKGKDGRGSRLIITDAVMIGRKGKPMDGLQMIDFNDEFYRHFCQMPLRQHVRINELGTAADQGKFDNQVVFKGTRFVFEVELVSEDSNQENDDFNTLMSLILADDFRLGGGTRNGYGHMKIVDAKMASLNLENPNDLAKYLKKSSCLNDFWDGYIKDVESATTDKKEWLKYDFQLTSESFFLFGSGLSDDDADMTPVVEEYIEWHDNKPRFVEGTVVPASSIKGALSHRTSFYWNKLNPQYADKKMGRVGDDNPAVVELFGCSGDGAISSQISRGKVLIDDIVIPRCDSKILNHVAIDRFTGGALDGALFTEKVNDGRDVSINVHIAVESSAFSSTDKTIRQAFENAIDDLKKGMLPLGGGVNRGNGVFLS